MRLGLILIVVMCVRIAVDAIERARSRAGVSHKELAICQGITQAQWSQQIHGNGHIWLDTLLNTPGQFFAYLLEELRAATCGDTHTIEDVYQALTELRPRMARASQPAQEDEVA